MMMSWARPKAGDSIFRTDRLVKTNGSIHHHDRDHRSRCRNVPLIVLGMSVSTPAS